MELEFSRFKRKYYREYVAWFSDQELNRQLGPMDEAWLEAVLSMPEAEGVIWAVFRAKEMIAVVETVTDPQQVLPAVITGIAVKPALRRQGIGSAVLEHIFRQHERQGILEHFAYISVNNMPSRRFFEKAGFIAVSLAPDEHGFIEFRRGNL